MLASILSNLLLFCFDSGSSIPPSSANSRMCLIHSNAACLFSTYNLLLKHPATATQSQGEQDTTQLLAHNSSPLALTVTVHVLWLHPGCRREEQHRVLRRNRSLEANPYHEFRASATNKHKRHRETCRQQPHNTPPLRRGNIKTVIKTIVNDELVILQIAWHFWRQSSGYSSACL